MGEEATDAAGEWNEREMENENQEEGNKGMMSD